MKKFIFIFVMTLMAMVNVNAQTLEPSRFIDNTYIGVRGGATALTHPTCVNGYEDWGHSIESAISLEVGKWITPKFGLGIEGTTGIRNGSKFGAFQESNFAQRFNYVTVAALGKFNLMNVFGGFKQRPFEMVAAAGPMWVHGFYKDHPAYSDGRNDLGVKFQMEFNFNLNEHWQFNLVPDFNFNLTKTPFANQYSRPNFDSRFSWYGIQAGFTYKIGNQFTESPYTHTQEEFNEMNDEINRLRAQEPQVVERVVEKEVVKYVNANDCVVYFAKGSAVLENDMKNYLLKKLAKGSSVALVGKASPEGSAEFNQNLSERRALAVADFLTANGYKVVDVKGIGASEGELSPRVVVVTVK